MVSGVETWRFSQTESKQRQSVTDCCVNLPTALPLQHAAGDGGAPFLG